MSRDFLFNRGWIDHKAMRTICPGCKSRNQIDVSKAIEWANSGGMVFECKKCGTAYYIMISTDTGHGGIVLDPPAMTTMPIGETIYIYNKEHQLNMRKGKIIAKDHFNYRIEFDDDDQTKIWVPHHWVKKIPGFKKPDDD